MTEVVHVIEPEQGERAFEPIESWEDFLRVWDRVIFQAEAVGLLQAGIKIPTPTGTVRMKRAEFYLDQASHPDPLVSAAAQKVVVRHLLTFLPAGWSIEEEGLHGRALKLLNGPVAPRLLERPYPKYVRFYLRSLISRTALSHLLTEKVVGAALKWGEPECLLGLRGRLHRQQIMDQIAVFLEEKKFDTVSISPVQLSGGQRPIHSLSSDIGQIQVLIRAVRTLLEMRYQAGQPVTLSLQPIANTKT